MMKLEMLDEAGNTRQATAFEVRTIDVFILTVDEPFSS